MSDTPDIPEGKPKRSPWWGVQRFAVSMVVLALFVFIFGNVVPRVAFKNSPAPVIEAEPSAELVEQVVDMPAEPEPQPQEEPLAPMVELPAPEAFIAPPPTADDTRLAKLEEKITAQENEIAALKTALQAQAASTQTKVESTLSALIVFGQLKDAIARGEVYATPLAQLKALTLTNPHAQAALDALSANAEKGLATNAKLSAQFTPLIKEALLAKTSGHYARSMGKLFSIRKVGEQAGNDDESMLARAEAQLARDDVKAALDTLSQLSPPAKDIMNPWMNDAEHMLAGRTQLDALQLALAQDKASE